MAAHEGPGGPGGLGAAGMAGSAARLGLALVLAAAVTAVL